MSMSENIVATINERVVDASRIFLFRLKIFNADARDFCEFFFFFFDLKFLFPPIRCISVCRYI